MEILPMSETFIPLHSPLKSQDGFVVEADAPWAQDPTGETESDHGPQNHTTSPATIPQQPEATPTPPSSRPVIEGAFKPIEGSEATESAATVAEAVVEQPIVYETSTQLRVGLGATSEQIPEPANPEDLVQVEQLPVEVAASKEPEVEAAETLESQSESSDQSEREVFSEATQDTPATSRDSSQPRVDEYNKQLSQPTEATASEAVTGRISPPPPEPDEPLADAQNPNATMPARNPESLTVTLKYGVGQAAFTKSGAVTPSSSSTLDATSQPETHSEATQTQNTARREPCTPRPMSQSMSQSSVSQSTMSQTKSNKAKFAPGLYARERNTRRAATKAFREPITPKKAKGSSREAEPVTAAPKSKAETRGAKRKAPEQEQRQEQPDQKRRKSNGAKPETRRTAQNVVAMDQLLSLAHSQPKASLQCPSREQNSDEFFVGKVCEGLRVQAKDKRADMGKRQALRILDLLELAKYPDEDEALFMTTEDATAEVAQGRFTKRIIVTTNQQRVPLQTVDQFLGEYYDDDVLVWIQDPEVKPSKKAPITRQVKISQVKERFAAGLTNKPWNLLELATHCDDGLRPAFLNAEDCRLLTKLKIPESQPEARRRTYLPGYKEVEKWALVAEAGALTEPHQDSHGYSTFITVNMGLVGFGWLFNPSDAERSAWRRSPSNFRAGQWRYIVLKPGQTVYFPAGTVHLVFRLPAAGNTLAFGGHILRCSNIVHWVKTLIEERDQKEVTNEDLTDSAPGYLARVEKFVNQAKVTNTMEKWGGEESIEEFLRLKQEFLSKKQR